MAAALVTALVTGCTSTGSDDPPGAAAPIDTVALDDLALIASLQRFDSCDAFLADVKEEALERVGPHGLGGSTWWAGPGFLEGAERSADDSAAGAGPATENDVALSGTNVQEAGVDEPDVVKTDGRILAAVDQRSLHLVDIGDPTRPVTVSTTPLAGHGAELLLHGDRLVVLQHVGQMWDGPVDDSPLPREAIGAPARDASDVVPPGRGWFVPGQTTVTEVDIADPASPRVERTWTADGTYVSARMVDGVVRMVIRSDTSARLPFVFPSGPGAEDAATAANRAVIEESVVEDWVGTLVVTDGDGTVVSDSLLAPCDQLHRPSVFSGFGLVAVLTADLDGSGPGLADGDGVGVLSSGETVYASATSLYVATSQWVESEDTESSNRRWTSGSERTDVHQFTLPDAGPARYAASGSVDGRVLDQFSMSEHDGHLRVAVTEGSGVGESASSVVVLARDGDRLGVVGSVGGLGLGEQIYAVRFMGDRGYVVTFREVDPLYTIDLSDPRDPVMLGELKIPGFSSYLHPVTDDLLIGVGQDATDEGFTTGSQVSLFDVSDPADPRRVAQLDLGDGTSSEVEYDHRAFLFWEGLAVLPFTSYRWSDESMTVGAIAIGIDAATATVVERGRLSHADQPTGALGEPAGTSMPSWERQAQSQIRRSLVVGDTLLTLSERGLLASDLATLAPLSWTGFASS
ncbi:MAG: beta-propeller domain-containing protein [Acidimicrobiales bacterium]